MNINEPKLSTKSTKSTKPKRPKALNPEKFYTIPAEFKAAITQYYEDGKVTDYLGGCLNGIAKRLSYYPSFINYTYKEDMIGDAIVKMYSALKRKKFQVKSDHNPFSYFTTIAWNAFINRIKKENKYNATLVAYKEKVYEELITSSDGHIYIKPVDNDGDDNYNDMND